MRKSIILLAILAATVAPSCSDDGGGSGSTDNATEGTTTEGSATEGNTTQGETGQTTEGGTETEGGTTGEIPDCPFKEPLGASCNPYPGCPGTGCADGDICTLVLKGDGIQRIECHEAGTVPGGGACDHASGPFCKEGLCVEGECRGFCVDNPDCGDSAACGQLKGVPGKPTICGSAQATCDPLAADTSCEAPGKTCYLSQSNSLTDCLDVKALGQQDNVCDCVNCCAAGFTCVTHEGNQFCARTCSLDAENVAACQTLCEGMATKNLTLDYGACIQAGEVEPPPDPIPCDILAQDCMGAAHGCYSTNQGDQCLQKGTKKGGADCNNVNECDKGLICFASKCRPICDPNDPLHPECNTGPAAQCPGLGGSKGGYCDE